MKSKNIALACALIMSPMLAAAQDQPNHDAHHPAASAPKQAAAKPAGPATKIDAQMKHMQEMHEKMMSAKTPEERKALMGEHMKAMKDAMSMMNAPAGTMGGGKQGDTNATQQQMGMMKMMMQMMMDRMEAAPDTAK
ncbi:hypothetical protein D0T25_20195 [Duganella sp. BJB488]|uniref:hypothetical protein n=1 Tax=unclassified Duganella TaxID=2636909 RepID=UPI000E341794|nr:MULTISPECIES: hypothetical protein [unclassified Duganella]RFP15505.1 hypothetical protein D0T26_21000 [Duganella sp. BJB489]RFP20057.1 hypothetical protein D0T25_20195 [Duganella sp. BJB488]RFP38954.1 hypothetical protein D0T24_01950 [Duganella sp. BJB480]